MKILILIIREDKKSTHKPKNSLRLDQEQEQDTSKADGLYTAL